MPMSQSDTWKLIADGPRQVAATARQAPRREAEETLRQQAAALSDALARRGRRNIWVSRHLRLSRRTLTRWRGRRRQSRGFLPRGRPCKESPSVRRHAVLEMLDREGPHIGLPTLRAEFPDLPRCELGELLAAYRRRCRRSVERLTWHGAGCVWATDHVVPPNPVDGVDRAALAVRDLASGAELAWQPVSNQTAAPTVAVLKSLIDQHGPPLVLKSDNGSAFASEEFGEVLAAHEIVWLPSPAYMPWYNGSCEAGNGSMRTRTNHFARGARGWTRQSLESARRQANELTRPQGHLGRTPGELWDDHRPISPDQRSQFRAAVARHRDEIIAAHKPFDPQNKNHQRQVHRQAVRQALLELGLLTITRRSIPLPLKRKKRAKIS